MLRTYLSKSRAPRITPSVAPVQTMKSDDGGSLAPSATLSAADAEYLAWFVRESAYYIEMLEDLMSESISEFWEEREHAYHILTEFLVDCAADRLHKLTNDPYASATFD